MTARPRAALSTLGALSLAVALLGLETTACTARPEIVVPADLPNQTDQGEFRLRWALAREREVVRAVGVAETRRIVSWASLGLFGVDRDGRVITRGTSNIRGSFGATAIPFEVALRPTGREERFELVLLQVHEGKPGE